LAGVLAEILDDPTSAFRTYSVLYQDFLVRLRMRLVPGPPIALPDFRRRLAISRSGVDAATAARRSSRCSAETSTWLAL
ncbi:ATP-binding protein, partial [Rhizobium johnstonii]